MFGRVLSSVQHGHKEHMYCKMQIAKIADRNFLEGVEGCLIFEATSSFCRSSSIVSDVRLPSHRRDVHERIE